MTITAHSVKEAIPRPLKSLYWLVRLAPQRLYRLLTLPRITRQYLAEYSRDYSKLPLSPAFNALCEEVEQHAVVINGDQWNAYSNALRREVIYVFEQVIDRLCGDRTFVSYLEIGSCRGISMSLIATALRRRHVLGDLLSIDPYFADGYREGQGAPGGDAVDLAINKEARNQALRLYKALDLPVRLIERQSADGLIELIREGRSFDLIYIDGSHEGLNPVFDLGLAFALLSPGGIVMLDDHYWNDVRPLKALMDRHAESVAQCWKVAAYRLTRGGDSSERGTV